MWTDRGTEKNILCPIFVPVFERDSFMKERNSGMSRMIIELSDGIITGIYTDSMDEFVQGEPICIEELEGAKRN